MRNRIYRDEDGTLPKWAWPGGYPIFYVAGDGGAFCPDCANGKNGSRASETPEAGEDPAWAICGQCVNYENYDLYCDHCGKRIESAYAEDEETGG